jgi:glycosyltransferase involved in cell wall biosynthesis
MRQLRIAHVVTALVAGGAELQALALAERLPRDRFAVDFLCVGGEGPFDDRARAAGVGVIHLGHRGTPSESRIAAQRRRLGTIVKLMRTVRGRYDVVDAWLYPNDIQAALGRFVTRTPVLMTGRRNMQSHERFGRLGRLIDRMVDRNTDAVVANSRAVADFAVRTHGVDAGKMHVIHNGVEMIAPLTAERRREVRAGWQVPADASVVGCIGRFHRIKGQDVLVEAFASVSRTHRGAHLVLVGDGPERDALVARASELGLADRVHLPGSEPDVRGILGALDIAVQSSRSEGMPNAILEAGAAGLPVVASAVGGTTDIVADGSSGILVPAEDPTALGAGISTLISDPGLAARYGAALRRRVETAFGMDRYVREYADLYLDLARSRGVRLDP